MNALRQEIEQFFIANFTGNIYSVDFGGNNEFTPPDKTKWYRVGVNTFETNNASVGKDHVRTNGIIQVQCFVPKNTGEKQVSEMCEEIAAIFQNKDFGSVKCFATSSLRIGVSGNWYQFNANTEFLSDKFS